MGRRKERAAAKRAGRRVVRHMIIEYLQDNPDATIADALPAIKDNIKDDFSESPFLELLLRLVEVLLPLLLPLLLSEES